ncbi:hypothetical protein NEMBOFW57_009248 [Staphylotrichum longicolle]|uniref:Fumarylacetoacetase-like C-terminal domain-containing protein n=1 Tax=Staphylotrichum longicolle TaxID=669026 RepID=A0AAD4HVT3_9PEZI|nr:hypothetical protein NEMBOFW57_009248 [Staphylotrichum longicolle]
MKVAWERLIRFVATDGRTLYGEPILPSPEFDLGNTTAETKLKAKIIQGDIYDTTGSTKVTDEVVTVKTLLGPLAPSDVPILRCVGLNYAKHIREAGRTEPPFPSIFFKPSTTVADHGSDVVIPVIAQDDQADYEGELVVIIGKDAKDVPESEALDLIANPAELHFQTIVDGEIRQDTGLDDLIFSVPRLIAHLSAGTTLQKGSVIMTGTPGGVGFAMKPPRYLVPGTQMEVKIPRIGTLKNGVSFASQK